MSDLVGNPEGKFSQDEPQIGISSSSHVANFVSQWEYL